MARSDSWDNPLRSEARKR
jgi:GNAT superfamily N-acetyltransferase